MEMKNLFAIGIIFLFIGVAIAPSINSTVVKTSDDLVEVTSQACGIQGFGNTTVKLTKEQYQNLEQYLVDFRARLNQTTTKEEAALLFKEAVAELNKYGLLPKGMNVEQAQKVATPYETSTSTTNRIPFTINSSGFSNLFCLIAGRATYCAVARPIVNGIRLVLSILYQLTHSQTLSTWWFIFAMLFFERNVSPIRIINIFNVLSLLTFGDIGGYGRAYPANGWIYTAGLLGRKNYTGSFFGKIRYPVEYILGTSCTGVCGFTGLNILLPDYSVLFLGTALWVKINNSYS